MNTAVYALVSLPAGCMRKEQMLILSLSAMNPETHMRMLLSHGIATCLFKEADRNCR